MPVDYTLFDAVPRLRDWAVAKRGVRRLWIYGSRLRGTQISDSDLDVALEIDPMDTDDDALAAWMLEIDIWRSEIAQLSPYPVQIEWFGGSATPKIAQYLACCSMLVYERQA